MPVPAYLTIKSRRQGLISANVLSRESAGIAAQPEHKHQILVQAYEHRIHVPGGASVDHHTQLERVHIAYQRIYWTNLIGKTSGTDNWQGRH